MRYSELRWIPNALTIFRCLLVAPVAWFIYQQQFFAALITFGVAGFTDGLDGFLARKFQWQSYIGAILDPIADKLLMTISYIMLTFISVLPVWLMVAVVLRDVVIVIGAYIFHKMHGPYTMKPSKAGKLSTFLQILLVLWILLEHAFTLQAEMITHVIIWITLFITVYSGLEYVAVWYRKSQALASKDS
jgi:cardiolipin synthase